MYERAHEVLSGGVASSYQLRDPWPIYLERGEGPRVWDVDGNELFDFHNGFGSMIQGHAHPAIGRAVRQRYAMGTHFAAPTEDGIAVAEELSRRFRMPRWRYTNSGSESTMDAIRIARAYAGRETVMKIFGSYHGHHDTVMVSIGVEYDKIGDRENLASLPYGAGIPRATVEMTVAVPFNDADAMERRIERLAAEGRKPACVIMEAAMMNLGIVLPEPGYLEAVRDITRRHGIVLIFDEVKTGLCIAAGGAVERFGVVPDMVTLAKSLGGGLPTGAIGGTEGVMSVVEDGRVYQVGTYNGNPLGMARGAGEPRGGPDPRGLPPPRPPERAHPRRLLRGDPHVRPAGVRDRRRGEGLRDVLAAEDRRLRDVQGDPGRRAGRPRVAVQHEPRRVHDARREERSGPCRSRTPTSPSTATSRCSRRWRAT
jgi:glutamate-1-semialdehyde 2,1-aminomutase